MPFLLSPHLGFSKAQVAPGAQARTGHVRTPGALGALGVGFANRCCGTSLLWLRPLWKLLHSGALVGGWGTPLARAPRCGAQGTEVRGDTRTFSWAGGVFLGWTTPQARPHLGASELTQTGEARQGPQVQEAVASLWDQIQGKPSSSPGRVLGRAGSWVVESRTGGRGQVAGSPC